MTLYETIRDRECDQRLAANIARLKELDATDDTRAKVDAVAAGLADLDKLISLHNQCAALIAAHVSKLSGPDL
jgi:hypothetical protein